MGGVLRCHFGTSRGTVHKSVRQSFGLSGAFLCRFLGKFPDVNKCRDLPFISFHQKLMKGEAVMKWNRCKK